MVLILKYVYSIYFTYIIASIKIHHWYHRLQKVCEAQLINTYNVYSLIFFSGLSENLLQRNKFEFTN